MEDWKSSLILSDLQAACNALGGWEDDVYVKEADCAESLKDLLKSLRRDDESYAVRRALGQINVVRTDLIPLIKFHRKDIEIFDLATKIIVNLTTPVILLYKEELPIEKNARNIYITLENINCSYKDAFLDKEIWSVLGEKLEHLMNLNYHERSDDDKEITERILVLLRNVLHPIHKDELNLKTDGDVSTHDRLLWALHLAGMDDLIIYMCLSKMEQSYTLHVLEILRLMLREQEPDFLAATGEQRTKDEVQQEVDELVRLREVEQRKKKMEIQAALQNRFARFSSTYQVKNLKAIGDRDLVVIGDQSKILQSLNNIDLDKKKKFRARAKNRRPEESSSIKRRTTYNIRLFLKEFCNEFLNSAFNALLPQARRAISRSGDAGDEGHYFWLLDFFLAFNRLTTFDIALVSEAISPETFHFVQTQMEKCHEMMVTDKRNIHLWVKRLHTNLKTFKQLLTTVAAMASHIEYKVREASNVLQKHLFHLPEYRDIALHLLLNFNENVAPVALLRDLATTVHIYLRMLELHSSKSRNPSKTPKKKQAKPRPPGFAIMTSEQLDNEWLNMSRELTTLLGASESQYDYDINLVLEGFHQYEEAFHIEVCKNRITDFLRLSQPSSAIGLLRASRRHYPHEIFFGDSEMSVEDEFMLLRQFFYAENMGSYNNDDSDTNENNHDDESQMGSFDFEDFLKRFINPKVIKAYGLLMAHFKENSADINKICVKMLHRIAFDLKMSAMFFQARMFATFDQIFEEFKLMPDRSDLKELARFAKYIVGHFVEVSRTNDLVLVELLFWKTPVEAYQIQYGYNENAKSKTNTWTEDEENELKSLYEEYKDAMQPGQDVVEVIQKQFSNQARTRRQIINQLRNLGLVEKGARFKAGTSSNQSWTLEEEQELHELYQKFSDSVNPLVEIMLNQTIKRPKFRVIEKLLELGCIHDRSEVRKKRVRKNGEIVNSRKSKSSQREQDPSCISKEFISTTDDSGSEEERQRHEEHPEHAHEEGASQPSRRKKLTKKREPWRAQRHKIQKIVNSEELKEILKTAVETKQPAVEWILDSMQDAVEDWKDSGNECVPLVPLAPAEHESLDDENFCKLLSTFGFVPPQEGVEQYWRISGDLSREMLLSRINVLKKASDGEFGEGIVVEEKNADGADDLENIAVQRSDSTSNSSDSDDGQLNNSQISRSSSLRRSPSRSSASSQDSGAEDDDSSQPTPNDETGYIGAEPLDTDKIPQEMDEIETQATTRKRSLAESPQKKMRAKKRKVLLESDSENDSEDPSAEKESADEIQETFGEQNFEMITTRGSSDEKTGEDDDLQKESSKRKKRKAILESDEDD